MRKGILVVIYVLFFFTVGWAVLLYNFQNEFTSSPEFLKSSLSKANIYDRLIHIDAKDLEEIISPDKRDPESEVSVAELQKLISYVSPTTLQTTVENSLDLYYDAYLNNKSTVAFDLTKIKADVLAKQPKEIADELNKSVPNVYDLKIRSQQNNSIKLLSSKYAKYIGIGLLALLLIVGVLLAKGSRGKIRALSIFFILAGVVVSLMWYVSNALPVSSISKYAETGFSVYLLNIMEDVLKVILTHFADLFRTQGFWLLGAGVVILIISFFIPKGEVAAAKPADPKSEAKAETKSEKPETKPAASPAVK